MPTLTVMYSEAQILSRIEQLAKDIKKDFEKDAQQTPIVMIGIMKGCFIFLADLIRELQLPCQLELMEVSSYVGTESSGVLTLKKDLAFDISGRNVLVVEDIVDTGHTMNFLLARLREKKPKALKLCSLLQKPTKLKADVKVDYLGFSIEDKFVIGYGLDVDERYRELRDICIFGN